MALQFGTQVEAENRRYRRQVGIFPTIVLALTTLVTSTGCAQTSAQKAEAELASVRQESDAKTLLERGKAFAGVGDHTRAEDYLASALEAGAEPREVLPLLIDVCVKGGRYRSAIQHGENHLRKHPRDLRTRVIVGALYAAISESKYARMHLEPVVTADETSDADLSQGSAKAKATAGLDSLKAEAHYLLAVVARDTDSDVVVADRHFREYLHIDPHGTHEEEARASLLKRVSPEEGAAP